MRVRIYEIGYSVSPGGKDTWAVEIEDDNFYVEGFDSAGQALEKVLRLYPRQRLEVEVKSLEWFIAWQETEEANLP